MKRQAKALIIKHRINLYEELEDARKVTTVNHVRNMKVCEDAHYLA